MKVDVRSRRLRRELLRQELEDCWEGLEDAVHDPSFNPGELWFPRCYGTGID